MRKISISALIVSLFISTFAIAAEVNIFNARHYKADAELYGKFTKKTGIKVNLINGKAGALEKRMIEEGADSSADLYITADAGRCGAFKAKGMTQAGLVSPTIKASVPKNFRTTHWVGVAKRARIVYYSPERVSGAELSGLTYESLADPKWKGRLVIRASNNIYNQSLVASLIKNNGKGKVAEWSKGMVSNMARSPKGNDTFDALKVHDETSTFLNCPKFGSLPKYDIYYPVGFSGNLNPSSLMLLNFLVISLNSCLYTFMSESIVTSVFA